MGRTSKLCEAFSRCVFFAVLAEYSGICHIQRDSIGDHRICGGDGSETANPRYVCGPSAVDVSLCVVHGGRFYGMALSFGTHQRHIEQIVGGNGYPRKKVAV